MHAPIDWALTDHINSVRDLASHVSGATNITNHRVYDAFGNLTSETNAAVDCLFAFTGRLFDDDTGLQNNLNRWYDPAVGRWLSEDPIGYWAGDANLYCYVSNRPLNFIDSGRLAVGEWWDFSANFGRSREIASVRIL